MRHPSFEPRRRRELLDELLTRGRAWLADWQPRDEGDFATALFKIAARLESEVTQRLDRAPERAFRGFLDWLGVRGKPGLAARLPVVFRMTPGSDPVDAPARVQLQITAGETPVNFETEEPLRVLPGTLATIVAADPGADRFHLPPADLFVFEEPPLVPRSWQLKAEAPAAARTLQLDPPLGLEQGLTLRDPSGQQYDITGAQGGIVTIRPPLASALSAGDVVTRVDVFAPFAATERNRQEHAIYIGSNDALNIEAPAWIAIEGGADIPPDAVWSYSGKTSQASPVGWIEFAAADVMLDGGRRLLRKPKGAIEPMRIDGRQSRWLRATRAAGNIAAPSTASALRLTVNCRLPGAASSPFVTALEGVANTAPLVLDAGFYPFGREPRQFDSFYLGSKEAFSKPSAQVTVHFALGEAVGTARSAIGFSDTSYLTVGLGADGRLRRISHGVTTTPAGDPAPTATYDGPTQPTAVDGRPISLNSGLRPGAALFNNAPHVSASAGNEVWLWRKIGTVEEWQSLGKPPNDPARVTETILTTTAANELAVYAIADGALYRRLHATPGWQKEDPGTTDPIVTIAPVVPLAGRAGTQLEDDGVVAVTDRGEMFRRIAGAWALVMGGPAALDPTFYPTVVRTAAGKRLCLARDQTTLYPYAFDIMLNGSGFWSDVELKGHALDVVALGETVLAVMLAADAANNKPPAIAVWDAFDNDAEPVFDDSAGDRELVEGPLQVGRSGLVRFFFTAGADGEAFVLPVGLLEFVDDVPVGEAILFTDNAVDWTTKIEPIVNLTPAAAEADVVFTSEVFASSTADEWVMVPDSPIPDGASVRIHGSLHTGLRSGTVAAPDMNGDPQVQLVATESDAADQGWLYLTAADGEERIVQIVGLAGGLATIPAGLPWPQNTAIEYRSIDAGSDKTVQVRPTVELGALDASIVGAIPQATLKFPGGIAPGTQTASDVLGADNLAVLVANWTTPPSQATVDVLVLVDLFGAWSTFDPPTPRNPALSWEYYDGTAWRLIPGLRDFTQALAKAGNVVFCVPKDLAQTDVVGRSNHWIRARLVGGDYGQPTVTVVSEPDGNKTKQTVQTNPGSVAAPYVGSLTLQYFVCCPVVPDLVLTRDNGGLHDQTDINRNVGSLVEYFIPLAAALDRVGGGDPSAGAADRALYLGFDTKLTGGPIRILFLVDEGSHDDAFPLRVDALAGNRFKPVVVQDGTRGLNESGTLELTLGESPQQTELFGTTKHWLRVRPGVRLASADRWQPGIRAAYLNGTTAVAAETQRLEPLGSSDGSPNQRFALARPPVIENSLELRVLERLGEEDIERLTAEGFDIQEVLPNVPKRLGCWVLWKQVVDPADEPPDARVYALDDATGLITFGDGLHGMIPPIGTNVILAEQYQRGGGQAANAVAAWSQINLVTPLSGVNLVFAPEGAAGGSEPQDADETVLFAPANLRLRDRALTLADFEILARQFSRDVAQARAMPAGTGTRLIVVMRGRDATPKARDIRALRAYLLERSLPALAGREVLRITPPDEVLVRVVLNLVVDGIEASGRVAAEARNRVERLLDPATGGHDGLGWPLGLAPTDTDIAAALAGIAQLEGIRDIALTRADGTALTVLERTALARLAPDGVTVNPFLDAEVTA